MSKPLAALACDEALELLYHDDLLAAHRAIQRGDDEALHDFRVALRRLQVTVENYAEGNACSIRLLRRLKKLIRKTNKGRDAEAMLGWLEAMRPQLDETTLEAVRGWRHALQRRSRSSTNIMAQSISRLDVLANGLARQTVRREFSGFSFGQAAAECMKQHQEAVMKLLGQDAVEADLHPLRLKVKTLRYLLLPFRGSIAACSQGEHHLQILQELLGGWHDALLCHISLSKQLAETLARLPERVNRSLSRDGTVRVDRLVPEFQGLLVLARLNQMRRQTMFTKIHDQLLDHDAAVVFSDTLQRAITELQRSSAG